MVDLGQLQRIYKIAVTNYKRQKARRVSLRRQYDVAHAAERDALESLDVARKYMTDAAYDEANNV